MAMTNHERVGKALELLKSGLGPFIQREFTNTYKDGAAAKAGRFVSEDRLNAKKPISEWDAAALLKLMWESWNSVGPWGATSGVWSASCAITETNGRTRRPFPAMIPTAPSIRQHAS